jgi:hypothetical protein
MTLSAVKSFSAPGSSKPDFSVAVDGAATDGNAPVTVMLTAHYHCQVPLVGALVCGLLPATLHRKATLPNQGAGYSFSQASSTQ